MTQVYLGLGSNIEQAENLLSGLDALSQWSELSLSPVYESPGPLVLMGQCSGIWWSG